MTTTPTDATRSKLRAALAPVEKVNTPVSPARGGSRDGTALPSRGAAGFSVIECVSDGIDAWWHKSTIGRAAQAVTPLVEPYLKPFVRRHYQAVLLGSAVAGALVSRYPGRSTRTAIKVAGPVLLSSVVLEVAKAGVRQLNRRP